MVDAGLFVHVARALVLRQDVEHLTATRAGIVCIWTTFVHVVLSVPHHDNNGAIKGHAGRIRSQIPWKRVRESVKRRVPDNFDKIQ